MDGVESPMHSLGDSSEQCPPDSLSKTPINSTCCLYAAFCPALTQSPQAGAVWHPQLGPQEASRTHWTHLSPGYAQQRQSLPRHQDAELRTLLQPGKASCMQE